MRHIYYNTVFAIADQTPYEGGDAVYTARKTCPPFWRMIGFEPDEHGVACRLKKPDAQKDKRKEH